MNDQATRVSLHPRLSLNAITTLRWSFAEDVAFWREAGLRCVGLFAAKLEAVGHDQAIAMLQSEGMACSSIVAPPFSLFEPSRWAEQRALLNRAIDVAHVVGGAVYAPPGKGRIDGWAENVAAYAEAVAPCVEHARHRGVTLAFEPSLRSNVSFAHNLRDSLDLADASGTAIVVDIGNCYAERDVSAWIARVGKRIAIVQVSDVAIGTLEAPGAGVRGLPGEGELPIAHLIESAVAAGYVGPFEVEFLGLDEVDKPAYLRSLAYLDEIVAGIVGRP
jgi:sugar phosphate isomerase/epimerase